MHNVWLDSALWLGLALLASLISVRVAVSVALIEIVVGAIAGNLVGLPHHRMGQFPRRIRRHPAHLPRRHRDRPARW
jgi:Kef-type K+ transport system membrane component KefB